MSGFKYEGNFLLRFLWVIMNVLCDVRKQWTLAALWKMEASFHVNSILSNMENKVFMLTRYWLMQLYPLNVLLAFDLFSICLGFKKSFMLVLLQKPMNIQHSLTFITGTPKAIQTTLMTCPIFVNYLTTDCLWNNVFNAPQAFMESTSCLLKFRKNGLSCYSLINQKLSL